METVITNHTITIDWSKVPLPGIFTVDNKTIWDGFRRTMEAYNEFLKMKQELENIPPKKRTRRGKRHRMRIS